MSGAEALVAASFANVVQIIGFAGGVLGRLRWTLERTPETHKSLKAIMVTMSAVGDVMRKVEEGLSTPQANKESLEAWLPMIISCKEVVEKLTITLQRVLPTQGDSNWTRAKKAMMLSVKDDEFKRVNQRLEYYTTTLSNFLAEKASRELMEQLQQQMKMENTANQQDAMSELHVQFDEQSILSGIAGARFDQFMERKYDSESLQLQLDVFAAEEAIASLKDEKGKGDQVERAALPSPCESPIEAPFFDYSEFQQHDKLQKELKSEAQGDSRNLAWKTTFLDLSEEQELLEEYLSWVQKEKEIRKPSLLSQVFGSGSLAAEASYPQSSFLTGLEEALLVDRQQVLYDQGVNRNTHGKTHKDERDIWERIIKVRKENVGRSVLEKYEQGNWENSGIVSIHDAPPQTGREMHKAN